MFSERRNRSDRPIALWRSTLPAFACRRRGAWLAAGMLTAFLAAFVFRWLTIGELRNDHFVHVARAYQILRGEWPVRDFVDPGLPLMYLVSAAVQYAVGAPLLSEALLVATAFGLSAALSFRLALLATGTYAVALGAVLLQIALYPRTYSYPKYLVYALAMTVGWWAVEALTARRLAMLAAVTAAAYYFRHDHGVYVAAGMLVLLVVRTWPDGRARVTRTIGVYVGFTALFVLPHLIYVQTTAGLSSYASTVLDFSQRESGKDQFSVPGFDLDVRQLWGDSADASTSAAAPQQSDAAIQNSVAFVFWLCWLMPFACVVLLVARGGAESAGRLRWLAPRIAMVATLAICANLGFLRDPLQARLPDVAMPHTVLGAWVLVSIWRTPARGVRRTLTRASVVGCGGLLVASVWIVAETEWLLDRSSLLRGLPAAAAQWRTITSELRRELFGAFTPLSTLSPFFAYVRQCTAPDDRLLYAGYEPAAYVLANRGFAGGHVIFWGGFHSSSEEQALTVARLRRQQVPFVLVPLSRRNDLEQVYADVWSYLEPRYVRLAVLPLPDGDSVEVLIDTSRGAMTSYGPFGWPCLISTGTS